jgi:hypothetical protein
MFVILALLAAGGGLTAMIISSGGTPDFLPFLKQVSSPEGSVMMATPSQAQALILFIGFLVFNIVGMAVTIGVILWLLHRGVKSVEGQALRPAAQAEAAPVAEERQQAAAKS